MNEAQTRLADQLVRQIMVDGTSTLDGLIAKWADHGYRPSLRQDDIDACWLADLYDIRAEELGLDVRAYRA